MRLRLSVLPACILGSLLVLGIHAVPVGGSAPAVHAANSDHENDDEEDEIDEEGDDEDEDEEDDDEGNGGSSNTTQVQVKGTGNVQTNINVSSTVGDGGDSERTQLHVESEGDGFRVRVEGRDGADGETTVVDGQVEGSRVSVRVEGNQVVIEGEHTRTVTDLPISVNEETDVLTVTTPAGEHEVAVLPDAAVQAAIDAGTASDVQHQTVRLLLRGDEVAYEVQGIKKLRFLGFFPLTTDITMFLSTQTGEVVATHQSWLDRVLSFFSSPA